MFVRITQHVSGQVSYINFLFLFNLIRYLPEITVRQILHRGFEDDFLREGSEVLKHVIPKMIQIWKQLGFPPAKNQERFKAAISHHKVIADFPCYILCIFSLLILVPRNYGSQC